MADVKFSELAALTTPASADVLAIVDTDASTSKKITLDTLFGVVPVNIAVDDATDTSSGTTGSIQTDGGIGVAKAAYVGTTLTVGTDATIGDDLTLGSDAAVLNFGADSDVNLTHVADTALMLNSAIALRFRDATLGINSSVDGQLDLYADTELEITAPIVDIDASTSVNVSNDLKLDSDAAVLGFGVDNDVTLTHVADAGLLLNSTMQLQFNDSSQYISSTGTVLSIAATDEIDLTATAIDINGTLDVSGLMDVQTGIVPDANDGAYLGTASFGFSDLFLADGAVLNMGDGGADVTLTHVADTGVQVNDTNKFMFYDTALSIGASADGALDLVSDGSINATVGAAGLVLKGTTPKLTIGDAGAEDTFLVFDGNAADFRIGLDDGTDKLEFGVGAAHGTTTSMTMAVHATDSTAIQTISAFGMAGTSGTFVTFGSSDTSPSVKTGNLFKTHASTQTLVDFDDGVIGQQICVISTAAVTYDASATELKCGSTDIVTASGDVTWWTYDGTYWYLFGFLDQSDDLSTGWSG